jgi:serine/threonine protein phosphatase 1
MRLFAIGDIHGCSTALARLGSELQYRPDDVVITLGDYVDRGPDSRGVIEYLLALPERCQLIALRGNHEVMMLESRTNRAMLAGWVGCGGEATLASYGCRSFDAIPANHWRFLEATRTYHETERDFFVHANAYPDFDLADQPDYMRYWEHLSYPAPHQSGRRMICGHTSQKSGHPLDLGHTVCIDTFAHGGGWLTCLEVRTGIYWQANQKGQLRTGALE